MQNKKMTRKQFYFLSFTWGFILSIIGFIVIEICKILHIPVVENGYGYRAIYGKGWGGFSMGPFCITSEDCEEKTIAHEFGHGLQNCYFGPFMIIITLWSICRYWYRSFLRACGKDLPAYDSIWFEGNATDLGKYYLED